MSELDRLRWQCRRGMLELDLLLSRLLESRFDQLTAQQRESLARLLELADNDLWDMVNGRLEAPDPGTAEIVAFLR